MLKIKAKTWPLIILFSSLAVFLVLKKTTPSLDLSLLFLITLLIYITCILSWLHKDAKDYNVEVSWFLKMAIIFIGIIGIPYYLFKTRKLRAFLSILYVFLAFLFTTLCAGIIHLMIILLFK